MSNAFILKGNSMAVPRKQQINLSDTLYYHCIGRCVRRAFLYGEDSFTQRNYNHRKQWVIEQLQALCSTFAIRVCAYAVMNNHYHLVLQVEPEKVKKFTDEEVILRCKRINILRMHGILRSAKNDEECNIEEFTAEQIAFSRNKLTDISSFMGALNEYLARRANKEDDCTGRFWEGRFKSMALLDDAALLTCMAYVDLNPVRAGLANSLEESDFTSIQERLYSCQKNNREQVITNQNPGLQDNLSIFLNPNSPDKTQIPCSWEEYKQLIEWTGQQIRGDDKGYLRPEIHSLLTSFSIHPQSWLTNTKHLEKKYSWAVGTFERLKKLIHKKGLRRIRGMITIPAEHPKRLLA